MLGLRQQIGSDEIGARGIISNDDDLAWPSDGINIHIAVDQFFRGGDVLIAGADDFVYAWNRGCAVSQCCDGLRAADQIDFK